jgi:integrase
VATVIRNTRSPYWLARLRLWVITPDHPRGGYWKQTTRSTKLPRTAPRKAALRVADEMERVGRPASGSAPTRGQYEQMVTSLLRAADVSVPVRQTTWRAAVADFLGSLEAGAKSQTQYEGQLSGFTEFLGVRAGHDLRSISPADFTGWHKSMLASGLATATSRNAAKTARRVFERAVILGYLDANPAKLHKLRAGPTLERQPFSKEDLTKIFAHIAAEEDEEWRTACLLGLYYGMRLGDAVNRRWDEVTVEDGVRVLRFVPQKKARGGKPIVLPLVGELATMRGSGPLTPRLAKLLSPSKAFGKLLDRCALKRKRSKSSGLGHSTADKTFHSFRHTAASMLADAGVDVRTRQMVLDHDDARVAAGYTHVTVASMAEAIKKACRL